MKDGFWPDAAEVKPRKEWAIYYRAIEVDGKVMIQEVWPPVGGSEQEIYTKAPLTVEQADELIAQMMVAMEAAKQHRKEKANAI